MLFVYKSLKERSWRLKYGVGNPCINKNPSVPHADCETSFAYCYSDIFPTYGSGRVRFPACPVGCNIEPCVPNIEHIVPQGNRRQLKPRNIIKQLNQEKKQGKKERKERVQFSIKQG